MSISNNLNIIFIIFAVSFGLLLVGVVFTYFWLVKKYLTLQHRKAEFDLQKGEEAQNIIKNANIKAEEIISQAQEFNVQQQDRLQKTLNEATQTYAKSYQDALAKTQNISATMLHNISNDIKKGVVGEIDVFRNSLQQEVVKSKDEIRKAIAEAFQKADSEVESYKKARMQQVDKEILVMVRRVAEKVLAKEIGIDEHEKLVLKALEEAKKQGIF